MNQVSTPPAPAATQEQPSLADQTAQLDTQIKGAESRIKSAEEVRDRRLNDADTEAASSTEAIKLKHKNEQATELADVKESLKTAKEDAKTSFKKASLQWGAVVKNLNKQKTKLVKAAT